jgi:hypothetical protein
MTEISDLRKELIKVKQMINNLIEEIEKIIKNS